MTEQLGLVSQRVDSGPAVRARHDRRERARRGDGRLAATRPAPEAVVVGQRRCRGRVVAVVGSIRGTSACLAVSVRRGACRSTRSESRDRHVDRPSPTHERHADGMFALEPWVTMADALGWGMTERPYLSIACSSDTGGPDMEKVGGSGARRQYREQVEGRWRMVATNPRPNSAMRSPDEPAPTLAFGHEQPRWVLERPATTVAGDSRVWPPGHKLNQDDRDRLGDDEAADRYGNRAGTEAIRLTVADALVLQSFPPDFPVQGTKTAQFRQVGNAVPPLLARRILEVVL